MTTPIRRNAFYSILERYLENQPNTKPRDAWRHFTKLAKNNLLPEVLIGFDGETIEIRPNADRVRTTRVDRAAFVRQLTNIRRYHQTVRAEAMTHQ